MKLPWKKENAAHKAPGGGKRRSFDLKAALTTRAVRVGGYSVAAAAIVIAIIVAANALVRALPAQWTQFDTTSSQLFSISDQTESVVGSLETPVTIHWIVQSGQEDATLETLLERYQALSENLTVEKVDPVVSPTFLEQYDVGSVYNNSLIVESEARYRYVDYYDIYEYDYTNYYTTGSVDMNFAGEGAITSAVSYVVNDDLPKVYTLTGHGEGSLSSDFQSAAEQDNVEFEELSLLSAETVPEDADCVLILAPQSDISDVELTALQAYLDGGGRLLLITDPPQEGAELTNLETLMAGYGVHAVDGIVVEEDQANYAMGLPYCLLPDIGYHTITSPLRDEGYYVLLPIAQGLTVDEELPEGVSVTELLTTSANAFSKAAGWSMTTYEREEGDADGPFALAVAATKEIDDETQSQVVWVSSSALVDDETSQRVAGGNQDFFLNCISWMCEQEESISIRAKSLSYEYLTMDSATASQLGLLITGVLPLGYFACGIVIWVRRKRR